MTISNPINNLGEFLGTIPIMVEMTRQTACEFIIHPTMREVFELIPKKYNVREYRGDRFVKADEELDLIRIYNKCKLAYEKNYHITQAFFEFFGLDTPTSAIRPQIEVERYRCYDYDFVIAPFSNRLSPQQLWDWRKWNEFCEIMEEYEFGILGMDFKNSTAIKMPIDRKNTHIIHSSPLAMNCNYLINSKFGCISVVNGMSSLCFALNVKNYILCNQYRNWNLNPESKRWYKDIPVTQPEEFSKWLRKYMSRNITEYPEKTGTFTPEEYFQGQHY